MYYHNINLNLTFLGFFLITNVFGAPGTSSAAKNQTSATNKGKVAFSHILPQIRKNVNKEVIENYTIALGYNVPSDDPKFDNSLLLQIQPSCSQHSQKHYESFLIFSFTQNGKSCMTSALPAQTQAQICGQNDYGFGTRYKLGGCSKFDFDFDNVEGLVSYHYQASDTVGWTPEWFELNLGEAPFPRLSINGAVIKCSFDDYPHHSGNKNGTKFMNFHCKPEGTTANGFTSKDHLEIGKKLTKFEDHLLEKKVWKLHPNINSTAPRNFTMEREFGRGLQKLMSVKICNFRETSCIKPIIDDHFKNSLARNTLTGKNDSKPAEKPASALNLPKSSQIAISNTDLTVGIMTSKPTDITKSTTGKIEETPNASPVVDCSNKSTRKFDSLSYFGGVLTTFGIAVIAFVGIKLYQGRKTKTENYNLM